MGLNLFSRGYRMKFLRRKTSDDHTWTRLGPLLGLRPVPFEMREAVLFQTVGSLRLVNAVS